MSDEEMENVTISDIENLDVEEEEESTSETSDNQEEIHKAEDDTSEDESEQTVEDVDDDQDTDTESQDEDEDTSTDENVTTSEDESDDENTDTEDDSDTDTDESDDKSKEDDHIDYKAAYERILAPFKANGKNIQVDSVEDAIRLMQMGANYNHKMAALKPHLKTVKMLENNNLLDEDKLNYLIEIGKGNPEAIKKAVADNKLDTYEFDAEKDSEYKPNDYRVNDQEVELDQVINELSSSERFSDTSNIVSKQWDAESKQAIYENPSLLKVIHSHVESGKYDKVSAEVDRQRMLGKLPQGTSDIEAYGMVAQYLDSLEQGGQNQNGQQPQQTQNDPKEDLSKSEPKENERRAKKKAIAPTKKVSGSSKTSLDPLNMSDEEFEEAVNKGLFKTV